MPNIDVSANRDGTMDFTTTQASTGGVSSDWAPLQQLPAHGPPPHAAASPQCMQCTARNRCLPAGMTDHEARCLSGITIGRRRVRKGQAIYRENDRFLFMYAVRFGIFKSTVMLNNGVDQGNPTEIPDDQDQYGPVRASGQARSG